MDDRVLRALGRVGADLSDERGRLVESALVRRYRGRRRWRVAASVAAVGALAAGGVWLVPEVRRLVQLEELTEDAGSRARRAEPATDERHVRFADGSVITLLAPESAVRPKELARERMVVELLKGRAHFAIARAPERTFHVEADSVGISVLGTRFTVERLGPRSRVEVEEGKVEVTWPEGRQRLSAGQRGVFPPVEPVLAAAEPLEAPPAVARAAGVARMQAGARGRDRERDVVGELLAAADAARLARRTSDAAAALRRVVADHPGDERAPLAAFTLGNLLLHTLNRPAEAAEAFARARTLAPNGPLAENALVRVTEAHLRAGDRGLAAQTAARYLREHPRGRRRAEMIELLETYALELR